MTESFPELTDEERKALDMTILTGGWEHRYHFAMRCAIHWMRKEQEQRERADMFKAAHAEAIKSEKYWKGMCLKCLEARKDMV